MMISFAQQKKDTPPLFGTTRKVYDKGDIYEDGYEGLYSVSEERFITQKEADSGDFKRR